MTDICFDKGTFNMYLFLLFCIIVFLFYTSREHFSTVEYNLTKDQLLIKVTELQEALFNSKLNNQLCQKELQITSQQTSSGSINDRLLGKTQQTSSGSINDRLLGKIYNVLERPDTVYPGGTLNSPGFNSNIQNQMIGYISNGNGDQYPLYGRTKYYGRSDRWDYYTNDGSRNKVKIIVPTKNYEELYDGDQLNINELGGNFTFKKYEHENFRYNPNI